MIRAFFKFVWEDTFAIAVITAAAIGALRPALFEDHLPLSSDALFAYAPWRSARPDTTLEHTPLKTAEIAQFYPAYQFITDSVARGDSLHWNPLEFGGAPFLASWRVRVFSPFTLPFYFTNLETALRLSALLKLLVAGLAAYYAARRLGLRIPLAVFVALTFQLSAAMTVWIAAPVSDSLPWLPLFFLFCERIALGQARHWPTGAATAALMLLGGAPEILAAALVFFICLILVRAGLLLRRPVAGNSVMAFAAALLLAAGLAAAQILPWWEFRTETSDVRLAEATFPMLRYIVTAFFPSFYATEPTIVTQGAACLSTETLALFYIGLFPILLTLLWPALRHSASSPHRHRVDALLISSYMFLVLPPILSSFAPFQPLFRLFHLEHLSGIYVFGLVIAGAAAAESWIDLNPNQVNATLKRLAFVLPAFLILAAIAALVPLGDYRPTAPEAAEQILMFLGKVAVFVVLLGVTLLRPSPRLMGYVAALLTTADLFYATLPQRAFSPTESLFPRTAAIERFEQTGRRIGGLGTVEDWPLSAHGIPQVYGTMGRPTARYAAVLERAKDAPDLLAAGAALVLDKEALRGPYAPVRSRLRLVDALPGGAALFEAMDAPPRAYLVFETRPVAEFDPAQLDSKLPPLVEGDGALPKPTEPPDWETHIAESRNTYVAIDATTDTPGVLVLADAWYPGWTAWIDGHPAPVLRVNGAFRGVRVAPGTHRVEFVYESLSFEHGQWISLASLLVTLSGLGYLAVAAWYRNT